MQTRLPINGARLLVAVRPPPISTRKSHKLITQPKRRLCIRVTSASKRQPYPDVNKPIERRRTRSEIALLAADHRPRIDVSLIAKACAAVGLWMCVACVQALPSAAGVAAETSSSSGFSLLAMCQGFVDFVLHLDVHLGSIIAKYGALTYAFLFGIVFCETGLVLTPFLPGDSLLFVTGALAGLGKLNVMLVSAVFITAAIIGDAVNYAIGSWIGERAVKAEIIPSVYIAKTERFFENYGGKTIVLARFVPIVRTFAPFVAGMSSMEYQKFAAFNIGGAVLWTVLFCGTGFFFGNLPFVEKNFSLVVLAIVAISVLPIVYEIIAAKNDHQPNRNASTGSQT